MPKELIYKNLQRNDIMEKSFTRCTVDVMSVVILICNEKLLSPCPTKTNIDKLRHSAIT